MRENRDWGYYDEDELFGFTVSAHPLDLHAGIAWDTYCPITRLGDYPGQRITTCGLIITERLHSQSSGDTMKFITLPTLFPSNTSGEDEDGRGKDTRTRIWKTLLIPRDYRMKTIRVACALLAFVLSSCQDTGADLRFRQATRLINEDGTICADGSVYSAGHVHTTSLECGRVEVMK